MEDQGQIGKNLRKDRYNNFDINRLELVRMFLKAGTWQYNPKWKLGENVPEGWKSRMEDQGQAIAGTGERQIYQFWQQPS